MSVAPLTRASRGPVCLADQGRYLAHGTREWRKRQTRQV